MSILWRVQMLGRFCVESDQRVITRFRTYKAGILFAYLALHPDRDHERMALAEMLWPDEEEEPVRNRFKQTLATLRRQLEPPGVPPGSILVADRVHLRLSTATLFTDVGEFQKCLNLSAEAQDSTQKLEILRQVLKLYKGELLPGLHDEWAVQYRRYLEQNYVMALRQLSELYEKSGELEAALEVSLQYAHIEQFDEQVQSEHIRLCLLANQPSAALQHYEKYKTLLFEELGEEPTEEMQGLAQQARARLRHPTRTVPQMIVSSWQMDHQAEETSWNTFDRSRLPLEYTRFFGRDVELQRVQKLFEQGSRLITLTGAAGCGKTRTATRLGHHLTRASQHNVWFVSLAEVPEADLIYQAILKVCSGSVLKEDTPIEQLVQIIESQGNVLIILDNFEHLVNSGAILLRELLDRLPSVQCLVTSRERLGLEGEVEIAISAFELPPEHLDLAQLMRYGSIQLFVDRAQAVKPDFQLTVRNAETVRQICLRLEGIPLALELAAAWAQTLAPSQILAKLSNRFSVLVGKRRDLATRHQTLHSAIDSSFLLLRPELQRLFNSLCIFQGGWRIEAAESIMSNCLESSNSEMKVVGWLQELQHKSLIFTEEHDGVMRYRMLETLREYGLSQLTESEFKALQREHICFFTKFAEEAETALEGPEQARWASAIESEYDNVRAAMRACITLEDWESGVQIGTALSSFWQGSNHISEGRELLTKLFSGLQETNCDVSDELTSRALATLGRLAWVQGQFSVAKRFHRQNLRLQRELGNQSRIAQVLCELAVCTMRQYKPKSTRVLLEQSLKLAEKVGNGPCIARALLNLGNLYNEGRDFKQAMLYYEQSLEMENSLGNTRRVAAALNNLGNAARYQELPEQAAAFLEEALEVAHHSGDKNVVAYSLLNTASLWARQGNYKGARKLLEDCIRLQYELRELYAIVGSIHELGCVYANLEKYEPAARLIGAANGLFKRMYGMEYLTSDSYQLESFARVENALGDERMRATLKLGELTSLDRLVRNIIGFREDVLSA